MCVVVEVVGSVVAMLSAAWAAEDVKGIDGFARRAVPSHDDSPLKIRCALLLR